MKKSILSILFLSLTLVFAVSCRDVDDKETAQEEEVEALIEDADNVEVKEDKLKLESPDGSEIKVKYDENGEIEKVKTDDNS
ncbi:hypothetical protein BST97_10695 [Nonlabens spongiae]|uniref:Uncharacterized protein n=1 Tax=Nonlabens spongiae TaxID=331648 RepID=A0A1W6MLD8_9FLAO|nr:hypothetical protein [Nonlabens spongiae]ARN78415.1 hypothetical protein BST97_10695 [Nonlabens spongiae]